MSYLKSVVSVSGLVALFVVGCGSSAVPLDRLTDAKATVRAAQEAGAQNTPQAALHLKMAKDQLSVGDRAASEGHDQQAARAYARAKADAELAVLLAQLNAVTKKLDEATEKTNALASGASPK